MIRQVVLTFTLIFVSTVCCHLAYGQDDLHVWREFVDTLKSGKMTVDKIRPYERLGDEYKPILLEQLNSLKARATPEEWTVRPEVIRVDDRLQYIVPWAAGDQKYTYCFSFIVEDSQWYFQHLEGIFIRLDKVSEFPTSKFPDLPEERKSWMREETYWSFVILNFYLPIAKEKGKEHALGMLRDGAGYFLAARARKPRQGRHPYSRIPARPRRGVCRPYRGY